MKGAVKLISVRGINLFLHWSFLLLLVLVILLNGNIGTPVDQFAWSSLFVAAVFVCVTLHELGHALVAGIFGIRAHNILLLPIGGVASIEKFPANPRQELAISASGPAVNLVIAGLLYLFVVRNMPSPISAGHALGVGGHFVYNLYLANLGLAVFNLIPAFPMDGGRILRALLAFRVNYINATNIAGVVSKIVAVALIGAGVVLVNFLLPMIGIFIILSSDTEKYYLQIQALAKGLKIGDVAIHGYFGLNANLTVKEAAAILINNFNRYFILTDNSRPVATINRMDIISALAEKKYDVRLKHLLHHEVISFEGSDDLASVLDVLARHEAIHYPVTVNGQISGIVNFNQVIEYILLHSTGDEAYSKVSSLAHLLSY